MTHQVSHLLCHYNTEEGIMEEEDDHVAIGDGPVAIGGLRVAAAMGGGGLWQA